MLTGLVRGELTVLLWGGAFGFVAAYTAVVLGLIRGRFRRTAPAGRLSALADGGVEFRSDDRPPTAALLSWSMRLEAVHSPDRRWEERRPWHPVCRFEAPPLRGAYAVTLGWELTDWFGFVRWAPKSARWETTVTVTPVGRPWRPGFRPETLRGPVRSRRTGQRSGDPFDVRRYVAGDDLRRLHWPLYAHAGSLFVRTADPSPPPEGRWRLVLDLTAESEEVLDDRLALVTGWLSEVRRTGGAWRLEIPGQAGALSPEADWLPALAALAPRPLDPEGVSLPPHSRLVTGPRTPAARSTLPLVVVPDRAPAPAPPRPWWGRR